jgi:outer membrane protein assembly factor BamB
MAETPTGAAGLDRRELLERGAVGALALAGWRLLPAQPAEAAPAGDWTSSARDLAASRHAPRVPRGLHERWRLTMAGGVTGTPALVGDRIIAASLGGEVLGADLETGRVAWRRRFPTVRYGDRDLGFFGGPAVSRGRLVLASDRLRCLSVRTGKTIWRSAPLRSKSSDDYFWGPPLIVGDLVLAGSGSGSELPTARGRLSAYSLRDGRMVWSTPMVPPGANGGGVLAPPTVDRGRGSVWVATGSPYKTVPGPNPGTASLVEIALRDGRVLWSDQVHPGDRRGLDFNSAVLLLGRGAVAANKDGIYAWDRIARRRLWHRRLTPASEKPGGPSGPTDGPEGGPIATDGKRIFALSNDGAIQQFTTAALEPATGRVLWRRSLGGLVFAAPLSAGGTLVIPVSSGRVFEVDAVTGRARDDGALSEPSACAPSSTRGLVFTGTGAAPFLPGDSLICLGEQLE